MIIRQIRSGPNLILTPIIYDYLWLYSLNHCFYYAISEQVFFGAISAVDALNSPMFYVRHQFALRKLRDQSLNHGLDFLSRSAGCPGSNGTADEAIAPKPEQIANDQ